MQGFEHPLARAALQEVIDLHAFFEAWLGGTVPNTEAAFSRLPSALAEGFSMVTPDGTRLSRAAVAGWLRQAHAAKAQPGPFRIRVTDPECLLVRPPLVAVGYVEEQSSGGTRRARRSTALFEAELDAPGGVRWLLLQETWVAPSL